MPQKFTGQACTPNTRTIYGMLLHTKYKTHIVFENSRTTVVRGGGAHMSRGSICAYDLPIRTNPNTHPSVDYN